jgi:hypothetical protein
MLSDSFIVSAGWAFTLIGPVINAGIGMHVTDFDHFGDHVLCFPTIFICVSCIIHMFTLSRTDSTS